MSKSSEAGGLNAGADDTMRAASAPAAAHRRSFRDPKRSFEEEDEVCRNATWLLVAAAARLLPVAGFARVSELAESAGENDVAAAIIGGRSKKKK